MTSGDRAHFVPFEAVDHTADLALLVRGRTFCELFANAALGLTAFLLDPGTIAPRMEEQISLEGADREECLVGWLNELLYREEVHRMVYRRFEVHEAGPSAVRATVRGERLDAARHRIHTDIKAATYHDLHFDQEAHPLGSLHRVRIVLDI
ncbi:MAG: archease [Candidatus Eisenbacteria bacterium]|nr:archease [Candidatus Eisenbacteria bacterium]MCC7140548.1 archease [Candidatus Eisenbacteria bacterium]